MFTCMHHVHVCVHVCVFIYFFTSPHQPVDVMAGQRPAVRWGLDAVSASHSSLELTVNAVQMATMATLLSASVSSVFTPMDGRMLGCCKVRDESACGCQNKMWRFGVRIKW